MVMTRFAGAALAIAVLAFNGTSPVQAAETYQFDPGHTEVRFSWDHAGVSIQSGEFHGFSGSLMLDDADVTKSEVSITLQAESLSTGVGALDTHMKSKDFFEVETYPEITFKSTGVKQSGKNNAEVTGDLTIKGVTKPVTLNVDLVHMGDHPLGAFIDYYKGKWVGFKASTTILRSDYNVGMFAPMTSDRIEISISTEMSSK